MSTQKLDKQGNLTIAPTINKTNNYELFKFYKQNRAITNNKNLFNSIKTNDLTAYNPIIVNEDFYIIDGQHRFDVCRKLNKPIYYVIKSNEYDDNELMDSLNKSQKSWRFEDRIHLRAVNTGGVWQDFIDFRDMNKLSTSNALIIFPKLYLDPRLKRLEETFDVNPNIYKIMDFLKSDIVSNLPFAKTSHFIRAVRRAFEIYDKKDIERLKNRISCLSKLTCAEEYLKAFDNLIQKGKRKKTPMF